MNSAGARRSAEGGLSEGGLGLGFEEEEGEGCCHREEATVRRGPKEEGELRVNVAAAWFLDFSKIMREKKNE